MFLSREIGLFSAHITQYTYPPCYTAVDAGHMISLVWRHCNSMLQICFIVCQDFNKINRTLQNIRELYLFLYCTSIFEKRFQILKLIQRGVIKWIKTIHYSFGKLFLLKWKSHCLPQHIILLSTVSTIWNTAREWCGVFTWSLLYWHWMFLLKWWHCSCGHGIEKRKKYNWMACCSLLPCRSCQ